MEETPMRSLLLSAVLAVASLGFLGAMPSSAEARPWYWSSYYYPTYTYYAPPTYYTPAVTTYYTPDYVAPAYTTTSYYSPPVVYSSYYTVPTARVFPRRVVYSPGYVYYSRPVVVWP
jgi:hypothetical protein